MYVVDFDDLCDEFDPWEELHALKAKYPGFKCTLFAIPARCSDELLERYRALDWVELAAHGYHHSSRECIVWGYDESVAKLKELQQHFPSKVFKAPGWLISEEAYKALVNGGWKVADHMTYAFRSERLLVDRYTYNLPGNEGYHGHTWDTMGNGPSDWDIPERDDFAFVSEACRTVDWGWNGYDDVQDANSSHSSESVWGRNSAEKAVKFFIDKKDKVVVDFGGNDGFVAAAIRDAGVEDVWSIENDPGRCEVSHSRFGVKTICADLSALPLDGRPFDWGYSSHTLEHVEDIEAAWDKMKDLCREGILVVLPVEPEKEFNDNPAHFHRNTAGGWCELLGLELVEDRGYEVVGVWKR